MRLKGFAHAYYETRKPITRVRWIPTAVPYLVVLYNHILDHLNKLNQYHVQIKLTDVRMRFKGERLQTKIYSSFTKFTCTRICTKKTRKNGILKL